MHVVIETNPRALSQAAALDAERKAKGSRSSLHGIPLLLKDNIATLHEEGGCFYRAPCPACAETSPSRVEYDCRYALAASAHVDLRLILVPGSYALLGSEVAGDAPVAAKLREAGAIFLGKTNMSEWANFRGKVPNGFSGRGGQTLSPYYPNGDASGSSSGSGVAMAIGLAAASLGSETDGSIVSPSSKNNIVGIKPTIGLVSRTKGKLGEANVARALAYCCSSSHPYLIHSRYSRSDVPFRRRRCAVAPFYRWEG